MKALRIVAANARAALEAAEVPYDKVLATMPGRFEKDSKWHARQVEGLLAGKWGWWWSDLEAIEQLTGVSPFELMDGTDSEDSAATAKRWAREPKVVSAARELQSKREAAGLSRRALAVLWSGARGRTVQFAQDIRDLEHLTNPDPQHGSFCYRELGEILSCSPECWTVTNLRQRLEEVRRARTEELRAAEVRQLVLEGKEIAAAIWTHANDSTFMDVVIPALVREEVHLTYHSGNGEEFRARIALKELADALRVNFPNRPEFDSSLI